MLAYISMLYNTPYIEGGLYRGGVIIPRGRVAYFLNERIECVLIFVFYPPILYKESCHSDEDGFFVLIHN